MDDNFLKTFKQYRTKIDKEIAIFFDKEIKKSKTQFFTETLKTLKEYSLRPAKRIRATLINQGYFLALGKNKTEILKTSIFIELIHNFLLIQDDILDKDKIRRGGASLHFYYQNKLLDHTDKTEMHYGISMSIIAGDIMESLGRQILLQSKMPETNKICAVKKLDEVLSTTYYGEMFEFWLRENKLTTKIQEKDILDIYKTKTAFYTFTGPLQMGALLAGGDKELLLLLEKIGTCLGIVLQIKDDIEDFPGEKKQLKNHPQPTLLVIKNFEECENLCSQLINKSKTYINTLNCPDENKIFLRNLADYIVNMNK